MSKNEQEKTTSSFTTYLSNIIKYINKYYLEHSLLTETLSIFGIFFLTELKEIEIPLISGVIEIDQIKFDQSERCVAILKLELDHHKLFEEMINLQSTFKEIASYRESLFVQMQNFVGVGGRNFNEIEEIDEK
ncbi:unnamed protein product [Rotaria socialis]|uniref:Uncharacterized protein n=1 Tax=Rotaria socialis TaxID=392032 RepID=A0A820LT50_9BILA|nr:unnamed protein product [Rotaria socialis]CAF3387079.1 unnamed protein product [Rotaria socialis]CAF4362801.1 unnamed protein product [Rotaria socialis]CAF4728832.1 unnamed protein product [Rotaria socialis]